MDKLTKLCQDVVLLWDKYHVLYLNGVKNTLVLAPVSYTHLTLPTKLEV